MEDESEKRSSGYTAEKAAAESEAEAVERMTTTEKVSEEEESMMAWLSDNDDEQKELWNLLEWSKEAAWPVKVKIINDLNWLPVVFQTAASYITINGNEESCGSSFSDSECSYMAGIDFGCGFVVRGGGAWDGDVEETRGWVDAEGGLFEAAGQGGTDYQIDDDMLARFMGEGFDQTQ